MVGNSAIFLLLALFSFHADAAATANDVCTSRTPFDAAVTTADGNTYFFRGDKYWKLTEIGKMADPPGGKSFQSDWELPGSIDAAFTFQTKTYIFKGQEVWTYNNMKREDGPHPIKDQWDDTLPNGSTKMGTAKIDSAIAQDNSVYFLKGKLYFEWKNKVPRIEEKKISQLVKGAKGFSGPLTAAFRLGNSFYFLKGSKYWKAEKGPTGSLTIATDKEYPKEGRDAFVDFFGCSKAQKKGSLGLAVGIICVVLLTILALVIFFVHKQKQRQAS